MIKFTHQDGAGLLSPLLFGDIAADTSHFDIVTIGSSVAAAADLNRMQLAIWPPDTVFRSVIALTFNRPLKRFVAVFAVFGRDALHQ